MKLMNTKALKQAAEKMSMLCGLVCPVCDNESIEDNGYTEYRCDSCDHRWGFEGGEWYGVDCVAVDCVAVDPSV